MTLERAAAEWHGPAPMTSSDGWLKHDSLSVGRYRQARERAVAAAVRLRDQSGMEMRLAHRATARAVAGAQQDVI